MLASQSSTPPKLLRIQCFELLRFEFKERAEVSAGGAAAFRAAGLREHALAGPLKALPTRLEPIVESHSLYLNP